MSDKALLLIAIYVVTFMFVVLYIVSDIRGCVW